MRGNQNFETTYVFRLSFSPFVIFSVIYLPLSLLPVQNLLRKHHRDGEFLPSSVVAWNFALSFSIKFLTIFVHILGSIEPITLIWVSLERSFPPAELEYRCQFWSNLMTSEVNKGKRSQPVTCGTGVNGFKPEQNSSLNGIRTHDPAISVKYCCTILA